ncbi:hypothetical protein ACHAXT_001108 [Thalassiosira profunda]
MDVDSAVGRRGGVGEMVGEIMDGAAEERSILLPSVASVLRNHLLSQISDEVDGLREENGRMDAIRTTLATMKISFGDEYQITADIADGCVSLKRADFENGSVNSDGSLDAYLADIGKCRIEENCDCCVTFPVPVEMLPREVLAGKLINIPAFDTQGNCTGMAPIPLVNLKNVSVVQANQQVGRLYDVHRSFDVTKDGDAMQVYALILLSEELGIRGNIKGLGDDDVLLLLGENGSEILMTFLQSGTGLRGENAVFCPFGIETFVKPGMESILGLLGPTFPGAMEDTEYEQSRLKIIAAISGDGFEVQEERKAMQLEHARLKSMRELLGSLEIHTSNGTQTLRLDKGEVYLNLEKDRWFIDCERGDCVIRAGDLYRHHATLSGAPMTLRGHPMTNEVAGGMILEIGLRYTNGILFIGDCIPNVMGLGSEPLTADTPVNFNIIEIPLDLVKDTFDMLGIDYSYDAKHDIKYSDRERA